MHPAGASGAVMGFAKGVGGLGWHPIKGLCLSGQALTHRSATGLNHVHEHYIIRTRHNDKHTHKHKDKHKGKEDKEHGATHEEESMHAAEG